MKERTNKGKEEGRKEESKKVRKQKSKKARKETSRPKASNGQRFPCPASLYWLRSSFKKQGSGPDRGRSPVEWGNFPYVRPSVCLLPLWAIQPGLRFSPPGLKPEPWLVV